MMRLPTTLARRARGPRAWLLALALPLCARAAAAAEPELALWSAAPLGGAYCEGGKALPAPALAFALPAPGAAEPKGPDRGACDAALPLLLTDEAAAALGRPLAERSRYLALYPDGHTAPVEVRGAARRGPGAGGELLLLADPVCPGDAPAAAAGQGGAAAPEPPRGDAATAVDGGAAKAAGAAASASPAPAAPDGGAAPAAGVPACAPEKVPPLALLLRPTSPGPPRQTDALKLSGVVRRRIGRQSLPARGHLVGAGFSVAAIFKRRADAVQLAIFGEDGNLRLYQPVPWRRGKRVQAKPAALLVVPELGGADRDGLLVMGAGDGGPLPLLLVFGGKAVRAYP